MHAILEALFLTKSLACLCALLRAQLERLLCVLFFLRSDWGPLFIAMVAAPSTPFIGWFSWVGKSSKSDDGFFYVDEDTQREVGPVDYSIIKEKRKSGKLTESSLVRYSSSGFYTACKVPSHSTQKGRRNRVHEIRNRGDALCKA